MLARAERFCARLVAFCALGAMLALAYLLAVVALGVVARALFDLSGGAVNLLIPGGFEQSTYALAALVFLAPAGAAGAGAVRVELLSGLGPQAARSALERLWAALTAAVAGALAWRFTSRAARAVAEGEVSQVLGAPLAPLFALAALGCLAWALISLLALLAPARARSLAAAAPEDPRG